MVAAHSTDTTSAILQTRLRSDDARAVHRVRRTLAAALDARADASMSLAELVLGELLGNATRHAAGDVELMLRFVGDAVSISVTDGGAGFDRRDPAADVDPLAESGRGLAIVSACTRSLEVTRLPGRGCRVTAVVPLSV